MGNTLDMAKIKEDHQARTQRICDAARSFESPGSWPEVLALALTELAAIWREEANRLSELPSPKPRGWKTTMDSLRDCATRVSGVAVAMRSHGLPEAPFDGVLTGGAGAPPERCANDAGPKAMRTTAGASTPENGAVLHVIHPRQDGKSELQDDLRRVHDGHMTVDQFREKHGDAPIPEDQMVEFLKNRNDPLTIQGAPGIGPELVMGDDGVFHPKASTGTTSPSPTTSPSTTSVSMANGATGASSATDNPVAYFLEGLNQGPSKLVEAVHEESLAEAGASIIERVHADRAEIAKQARFYDPADAERAGFLPNPGPVTVTYDPASPSIGTDTKEILEKAAGTFYMNSGGILDTSNRGEPHLAVEWSDNLGNRGIQVLPEGHDVQIINGQFTIGAADAPPAWTNLPAVPVIELDAVPTLPSPGHTSVSQANMVGECALKWKLAKRHGAPERPGWALVGGKALHACIEVIEKGWGGPSWGSEGIALLWAESFAQAIKQTQAENPLFPVDTWHASNKGKEDRAWWDADGPEMVHHYLAWRAKWVADGWELLRTADGVPVVELEFLAFLGGSPVKGFIDSGWYHSGRNIIAIIDWKSGTSKPADYFQQATYRHALEPLLGVYEYLSQVQWLGAFWDARSGELGPLVDLDVRHPKAEVEMRLSMPRRIDAAGLYMPNVNTGYGGCGSCSLKRSCPVGSRIGTGEVKL